MITYEYMCTNCGHQFEAEQSIKDKPLVRCPECKKHRLQRIMSGGNGSFMPCKEPTTIGQLADRNYKKNKGKINDEESKKKAEAPTENVPWYGKTDKRKINKMSAKQKRDYIMEGKE